MLVDAGSKSSGLAVSWVEFGRRGAPLAAPQPQEAAPPPPPPPPPPPS